MDRPTCAADCSVVERADVLPDEWKPGALRSAARLAAPCGGGAAAHGQPTGRLQRPVRPVVSPVRPRGVRTRARAYRAPRGCASGWPCIRVRPVSDGAARATPGAVLRDGEYEVLHEVAPQKTLGVALRSSPRSAEVEAALARVQGASSACRRAPAGARFSCDRGHLPSSMSARELC